MVNSFCLNISVILNIILCLLLLSCVLLSHVIHSSSEDVYVDNAVYDSKTEDIEEEKERRKDLYVYSKEEERKVCR